MLNDISSLNCKNAVLPLKVELAPIARQSVEASRLGRCAYIGIAVQPIAHRKKSGLSWCLSGLAVVE